MGHLALAIKRLQEAQTGSVKLEKEIRKQAMEEAATTAEQTAKSLGLTSEGAKTIRNQILGLSS
nr:phage protein Gp27 family protein [Photobacterium arenosum]